MLKIEIEKKTRMSKNWFTYSSLTFVVAAVFYLIQSILQLYHQSELTVSNIVQCIGNLLYLFGYFSYFIGDVNKKRKIYLLSTTFLIIGSVAFFVLSILTFNSSMTVDNGLSGVGNLFWIIGYSLYLRGELLNTEERSDLDKLVSPLIQHMHN